MPPKIHSSWINRTHSASRLSHFSSPYPIPCYKRIFSRVSCFECNAERERVERSRGYIPPGGSKGVAQELEKMLGDEISSERRHLNSLFRVRDSMPTPSLAVYHLHTQGGTDTFALFHGASPSIRLLPSISISSILLILFFLLPRYD